MSDAPVSTLSRLTLPALVAQWSRVVDQLARHDVSTQDFPLDMDLRHEISQRLRAKPTTLEIREMLAELDELFRANTEEVAECLHGAERAAQAGWTAQREWYYWRRPVR